MTEKRWRKEDTIIAPQWFFKGNQLYYSARCIYDQWEILLKDTEVERKNNTMELEDPRWSELFG